VRKEEAGRLLQEVAAAVVSVSAMDNLSKMLAAYVANSSVPTIIGRWAQGPGGIPSAVGPRDQADGQYELAGLLPLLAGLSR
jgi:hypothetical protein